MTGIIKQAHDGALSMLPMRWSLMAALLLQVFLLNAQTTATTAERLRFACEDLHIELGVLEQRCETATACFQVSGGTEPYTITTQSSATTPPITANPNHCFTNLPFGHYVVTVSDAEGCSTSTELNLPTGDFVLEAAITNVTCNGGSDGRLEAIVSTDVEPLFYRWTGPNGYVSEHEVAEGLHAGTYRLRLTTEGGVCVGVGTYVVTQPEPIHLEVSLNLEPCQLAGACVNVEGGTAPYTVVGYSILPHQLVGNTSGQIDGFDLPDGIPFNPTISDPGFCADGLSNGTYYIVVVDAHGCYRWDDFGIQNTATFTRQREIRRVSCHGGNDGRICFGIGIGDGTAPFVTTLTPTPAGTNGTITTVQGCFEHLVAGLYTLTTTDAEGCMLSENIVVGQPDELTATFNRTNSNCDAGGADGCLTIAGGTPAYQVSLWQFPAPGPTGAPLVIFSAAQVSVEGGTRVDGHPFESTTSTGNVRCVQNIPPGIYYILVVDSRQCYTLVPLVVHEVSNPIEAHFEINSTSPCSGPVSGCLYANGGTAPYHLTVWRWNSPLPVIPQVHFNDQGEPFIEGVQPTNDLELNPSPDTDGVWCAQNIVHGFYLILVQDANGCYVLVPVTIPSGTGLQVTADVRNANCNGLVSRIKLTIEGGTAPYTIYRNNNTTPAVTQTNMYVVEDLEPGTYTFTIYDNFQCSTTITVVIAQAGEIDLNLEFDPFGQEACVHPAGGTAPYMVRWFNLNSNQPFADGTCAHNLAAGAYRVLVIDASGCETDAIFFIEENPCSGGEASVESNVIESGQSTTFILHNWSGQSIQWQFKTESTGWLNIPGATTAIYHTPPMHSGTDRVIQVRAVVQCNGAVLISEPTHFTILGSNLLPPSNGALDAYLFDAVYQAQLAVQMAQAGTTAIAQVFPTLSSVETQVRFTANVNGNVRINLVSSMGTVVARYSVVNPVAGDLTVLDLTALPQGAYFVRIEYGIGVQTERIMVVR